MESKKVKKFKLISLGIFLAGLIALFFGPVFGLYGFILGAFIMVAIWFLAGTFLMFIYQAIDKERDY